MTFTSCVVFTTHDTAMVREWIAAFQCHNIHEFSWNFWITANISFCVYMCHLDCFSNYQSIFCHMYTAAISHSGYNGSLIMHTGIVYVATIQILNVYIWFSWICNAMIIVHSSAFQANNRSRCKITTLMTLYCHFIVSCWLLQQL